MPEYDVTFTAIVSIRVKAKNKTEAETLAMEEAEVFNDHNDDAVFIHSDDPIRTVKVKPWPRSTT